MIGNNLGHQSLRTGREDHPGRHATLGLHQVLQTFIRHYVYYISLRCVSLDLIRYCVHQHHHHLQHLAKLMVISLDVLHRLPREKIMNARNASTHCYYGVISAN